MQKENEKQTRGVAKNAEIVHAARELFLENGFNKVSMDLIAETAKVSKRTVYGHFANKESLFGAVMMDLCRETCSSDDVNNDPATEMSLDDILFAIGKKYLSVNLLPNALALYRIVSCESAQFPELANMYWDFPKMLISRVSEILLEFDQHGKISTSESEVAALQFLSLLRSPMEMPHLFELKSPPSEKKINQLVQQSVSLFLNGLGTKQL